MVINPGPKLTKGKIYLTLGTVEQIRILYPDSSLLYHPTTQEMQKAFEQHSPYEPEGLIVWPKNLKPTGSIKSTKQTKVLDPHAIPTDQFLRVDSRKLIFIPAVSIDGTKFLKDEAKKLQGGPYQLLDLRESFDHPFPLAQQYRDDLGVSLDLTSTEYCQGLLESLGSPEGVVEWGRLKAADIYRWFRPPGEDYCPFLMTTRCMGLGPYLKGFLDLSARSHHQSAGKHLQRFAIWVFCTNRYWGTPGYEGLTSYVIKKGKLKGKLSFSFRASAKARQVWLSWIGANASPASALPLYRHLGTKSSNTI